MNVFFCFSVLGMHLFGCKFCEEIDDEIVCDRKNFDSLLWAIVTVFQVSFDTKIGKCGGHVF